MNKPTARIPVPIRPELLRWARERAGRPLESLVNKFPKLPQWENGEVQPTLKQLEKLAKTLHVPLGFLFLNAPPDEPLPIPDFRTIARTEWVRPSPELLDTIYICQQRQEWYRNYLIVTNEEPLTFISSANLDDDTFVVAAAIRERIHIDVEERRHIPTWTQAFSQMIDRVEDANILVMVSGVVGNNTHRKLNPEEFRGFTLIDEYAPLIFINGADTLSAKMFTLAHELAHIWLGESGVSNTSLIQFPDDRIERWCNQVAAELLVPAQLLEQDYRPDIGLPEELNRLARIFKVSTLVILRRLYDLGYLAWEHYQEIYQEEFERLKKYERPGTKDGGGNFYSNLTRKVGKRFATALIVSVMEGQTLFRDAFKMLGISRADILKKFAEDLGIR